MTFLGIIGKRLDVANGNVRLCTANKQTFSYKLEKVLATTLTSQEYSSDFAKIFDQLLVAPPRRIRLIMAPNSNKVIGFLYYVLRNVLANEKIYICQFVENVLGAVIKRQIDIYFSFPQNFLTSLFSSL